MSLSCCLMREQPDEIGKRLLRLLVFHPLDLHSDHADVLGWSLSSVHQRYKIGKCPQCLAHVRVPACVCLQASAGFVPIWVRSYGAIDEARREWASRLRRRFSRRGSGSVGLRRRGSRTEKRGPVPRRSSEWWRSLNWTGHKWRRLDRTRGLIPGCPTPPQDGQQVYLSESLRWGRRRLGWTLAELARRSGVSASRLSRIERGQVARSAVFTWHPEDGNIVREDRWIVFGHPLLAAVAGGKLRRASF